MDLPLPTPAEGEVRVRVVRAGVNPFDWKIADGILQPRPHVFPLVLGIDAAGEVDAVGPGPARFAVGDRICGSFLHDPVGVGTYAEFSTTPTRGGVAKIPSSVGYREAAAIPTAGMTALAALDWLALDRGASLVVVGAAGGIGTFAVPLAAGRGYEVTAVVRHSAADRARRLGAANVIDLDRDPVGALRRQSPSGVDGLLDVGSDAAGFAAYADLVRSGGAALTTMYIADEKQLKSRGVRAQNFALHPKGELLDRLLTEMAAGRLPVPVENELPLTDGPDVLARSRARTLVGKTVLRTD